MTCRVRSIPQRPPPFAGNQKYREQRRARRELVETEFKAIAEVLSPEQREKARRYLEQRLVTALIAQTVSERLRAAAEKLGLTSEQQQRIIDAYKSYDEKYEKLSDDRRELLKSELKSVGEILTPEQREKVRNYFQDHVVMVDVQLDPNDPQAVALLKETIAERLDATADKLGLTQDQREDQGGLLDLRRNVRRPARAARDAPQGGAQGDG